MQRVLRARCWCALALGAVAGCAQNPYLLEGQVQSLRKDQQGLTLRHDDLQQRSQSLDSDNQSLQALLAQTRQQNRLLEDQSLALREQLKGATQQIARLKEDRPGPGSLASTSNTRPRASISANSSLRQSLPQFNLPGVFVRDDGDVVRVELPGSMFESGGARLQSSAARVIEDVAAELFRRYPEQIFGVEGHTDSDPILHSNQWPNNHQLSIGRATAVYDHLVQRTRLKPQQLFVVGHGPNHPVVSNATPAGKERNRRVELVIYPEQVTR